MHDDERNVLLTRGRDWFHCGVCFNSLDIFFNMYLSEFYFFCFTAYFQATVHSTMGNKRRLVNALACSKRSDSGERCEVKKAMKSRGGLGTEVRERSLSHLSPSLAFIFSRSFLRRTAPHYLNAWNRLQRFGLLSSSFQERPGLELILFAYSRRIISFF